jgi:hypothetical protein
LKEIHGVMGKPGVVRKELWSLEILEGYPEYNASKSMLKSAGWYPFLKKFKGHNDSINKAFEKGFGNYIANIDDLIIKVSQESVSQDTGLP